MNLQRLLLRLALGRRLPIASGELRVAGLQSPITIRRDGWGVPHIEAEDDGDASFGIGFCQGQDRAGQLEMLWRVGRGRLAEWVGSPGLPADRMSRRIGFRRAAESQLAALSPEARASLDGFARGVNAGHTAGLGARPHEFAILGGNPSPWDAADSLAVLKLQSFLLPSNWDVELARLRILQADGPEAVAALDPVLANPVNEPRAGSGLEDRLAADRLAADLAALHRVLPRAGGSNNWAVAGAKTISGKPLLANDPHLAPTAPGPWYLAHVRTPQWSAVGATMAGAPGFAIGHNNFAAWGVTAGLTDNTDLFLETLSENGRGVREPDGSFVECQKIEEVIRVKGKPDVVEEVLITPRGPIVSPLFAELSGVAISMKAVWLEPLPIWGFFGAARARSFAEFRHCFAAWPLLPLNVVYADSGGTIGWQLVGQLPRRRSGRHGLVPALASDPLSHWEPDLIPFHEMPCRFDPPEGVLATANQRPEGASSDLGLDFLDPYRFQSIHRELLQRDGWDLVAFSELQRDTRSLPWEEMRGVVLSLAPVDAQAAEAVELLRAWDGHVGAESPAAAIYELFVAEMCVRVAKAKAPQSWKAALGDVGLGAGGHNLFADRRAAHLVKLLREQPPGWFKRTWPEEMLEVLGSIVRKLRREVGPGAAYWAWGHLRQLRLDHLLFGKHWLLGRFFNLGPIPCGGDQNTISQGGARPLHPTGCPHNIANLRAVFDLAELSRSTFVLCGGQSGNPCSRHYADQLPLWREGASITIACTQEEAIRGAKETLRLLPERRAEPPPSDSGLD